MAFALFLYLGGVACCVQRYFHICWP